MYCFEFQLNFPYSSSTFKKYCPVKLSLNYDVAKMQFIVTKFRDDHANHPMEEDLKEHYPEFRKPPEKAVEEANNMMENDVAAHHIRSKVCSFGKKVTRQDIQNLR